MHELSLLSDMTDLIVQDAESRGIKQITKVVIEVGEMSGALPHALLEAFPIACKGTILEGATLSIRHIPAEVRCKVCGKSYFPTKEGWSCPSCSSSSAVLNRGTELRVVSYTGEEQQCL